MMICAPADKSRTLGFAGCAAVNGLRTSQSRWQVQRVSDTMKLGKAADGIECTVVADHTEMKLLVC